jgi:predicted flap endonuclease-1-like 5' DNA nuclease
MMASYSIDDIDSIGPFYAPKLKAVGIRSTTTLLRRTATPKLRKELAEATNIKMALIVQWANIADLTRVSGIAVDYAELLVAAGVNTAKDLARRNPTTLVARLAKVNGSKPKVELLPQEKRLCRWIASAKSLPIGMEY